MTKGLNCTGYALVISCCMAWAPVQAQVDQKTVPLIVEGNRPFVEVSFRRTDGSMRTARFLVDSGGGGFLMTEPLARDVGLTWGKSQREEGKEFALVSKVPDASLDGFSLELSADRVFVVLARIIHVPI